MPSRTESHVDELTLAETRIAERKSGMSIKTLDDPAYDLSPLIGALGWVWAKRTDPTITFDAYMESRTFQQAAAELGLDVDDDLPGGDEADAGKDEDETP